MITGTIALLLCIPEEHGGLGPNSEPDEDDTYYSLYNWSEIDAWLAVFMFPVCLAGFGLASALVAHFHG